MLTVWLKYIIYLLIVKQEFKYLRTIQNDIHGELNVRLSATNRCYYALINLFKLKLLRKYNCIQVILIYVHDTWGTNKTK